MRGRKPLQRQVHHPQHQAVHEEVHVPVHAEAPTSGRLRRAATNGTAFFDIDPAVIPDGMDWNYKTETVLGEHQDVQMGEYRANHWENVPLDKYPGVIKRQRGAVLMQRPKYLSEDAHEEYKQVARNNLSSHLRKDAVEAGPEAPRPRLQREWHESAD